MRKAHSCKRAPTLILLVASIAVGAGAVTTPVFAGNAGAFLGGMVTSRVLTNMSERTEAQQVQAQAAVNQSQQASSAPSVEQRIQTLDQLRANGSISESEYKSRKQAIIDSI
jgi:Zn-dependent protease with chaperone function